MHRPLAFLAGTVATLGYPAAARADETLALVTHPTPVGAFAGHVVWSEYDPVANAYFLTQRFQGVTARLPVRPRAVPFDVDVGRNAGNDAVAAYSRCSREPGPRGNVTGTQLTRLPEWITGRGCDLHVLNLRTNVETRVGGASSAGASEFLPSVWRDRIAFARVYDRRRGRAGNRAHLYIRSLGGGGINRALPTPPRSRRRACAFPPPRSCRRVIEPGPTAIDLGRRYIAFAWDSTEFSPLSEVYYERIRAGRIVRHRVARGSSGDMTTREYLVAHIDARNRASWILSMHGNQTLTEVGRYAIQTGKRDVAQLQPLAGDPVIRTVLAGAADGSTAFYLGSGLVPLEELPCIGPFDCLAEPGCSLEQPCELRAASALEFKRPKPR